MQEPESTGTCQQSFTAAPWEVSTAHAFTSDKKGAKPVTRADPQLHHLLV